MSPAVGLPLRPRVFGPFVSILTVATSFIIGLKVADIPAGPPSAHNSQVVRFPQQRPSRVRYHRTFSRALWSRYQPPQGRAPSGTDQSFSQRKPVPIRDLSTLRLQALCVTKFSLHTKAIDPQLMSADSVVLVPSMLATLKAGARVKYEGKDFAPALVKTSDGAIRLHTPFSRLLGKAPINRNAVEATTTPLLCFRAKVAEIQSKIRAGFSFQLPLWQGMRREDLPIDGFCVAAGIPSTEKAVEIMTAFALLAFDTYPSSRLRNLTGVVSWSASPRVNGSVSEPSIIQSYSSLDELATFVKAFLPLPAGSGSGVSMRR
ncbi:hypothetical protein BDZ89DRAFT_1141427 [Hymenopellis radicata]|nr:hypothetical protein BDZ89DRAFT_1141427 [Hymenopellis radicata]